MNRRREARVGILFALPWILGFGIFLLYPILASLYYSFTNYSILRAPKWIGLSNYQELVGDKVFIQSMGNTLYYLIGAVPLGSVGAIGLAMLLNTKVKGIAFYRTLFYLPSLVPMVALGTLFMWVFNGDYGLLNSVLREMHISPPNWMGDPSWAKWTLIMISTWGCGQAMVIYLAALQDVPVSLYEAAELDGARLWQKTRNVTLPMISPVILFNVLMGMIGALQVFAVPYVMFPGGAPARSTYFFTSYLYDNAFQYQRMGYASAIGWVMFIITLTLTLISLKVSDRHVHYERS
ncbi:MAG: sugar ABC transporter permease [Armatimonadetes bacterium]|nr:sugar ABC transporter permease [Armatimonadota bacterium]MBS1727545.1 sugar ABC transporter permease [Armatimonadota bacterium]